MLAVSQSFVTQGKVMPIVFLVFTDNSQAYLWVEDMTLPPDYEQYHKELAKARGFGEEA